ncbi:MAG TPA: hypothetical protein VN972_01930, partial [Methylomirabilota bacterium]|nr:hypothetical protein [Methylomirabilota bacterium]
ESLGDVRFGIGRHGIPQVTVRSLPVSGSRIDIVVDRFVRQQHPAWRKTPFRWYFAWTGPDLLNRLVRIP